MAVREEYKTIAQRAQEEQERASRGEATQADQAVDQEQDQQQQDLEDHDKDARDTDETDLELEGEEIGDALDEVQQPGFQDERVAEAERLPAPSLDQNDKGESHWNNPENVKNAIHYFAEVRPQEREAAQADQERDDGREDPAAPAGAEVIGDDLQQAQAEPDTRERTEYQPADNRDRGAQRDTAEDRKPGREEYQPGSYKPEPELEAQRERDGR